jgi:cellobiose-specific phosphotransferase system component IIA
MGWDSLTEARATLSEALSTHKLLLEGDRALTQEKERSVALHVAEQLVHAQDAMSSVVTERSDLYNEIRNLSSALELKAKIVKHLDAYYLSDAGEAPSGDPYCLLCWERDHTLLHLIRKSSSATCCPYCDREYMAESTPFGVK